jgi:aspartyl-tRNA synthetase
MLRTHTCGALRAADIGAPVTLAGWVNRRRDHGGLIFVDLRDRNGLTQVVFDPATAPEAVAQAHALGNVWVVAVDGTVRARPEGQANPDMATGEVEVLAGALRVLNPAKVPPFEVARDLDVDEAQRLRYRYLDLRRVRMRDHMVLRHRVSTFIRNFLDTRDFIEVETPILLKTTPEGARDFLVPSRLQPGRFYALPQSPQQMKQLLMVAGVDRYFQIARCFRDEDLRADRQLEFTQLDLEMAFVEEEDIMALNEALLIALVGAIQPDLAIRQLPFPRLTHAECLARYGSDKPDLRFGLELVDIGPDVAASQFQVFSGTIARGGQVKAIAVPAAFPRRVIDELEAFARTHGAAGLAWLAFEGDTTRGSVAKQLSEAEIGAIRTRTGAGDPATVLIVAGDAAVVADCLGRLRVEVARRLEIIPAGELAFMWLTDPPLFGWNADEQRWDAEHHPFTAPQTRDLALLDSDPGAVRARAYDIVCNGYELGGGSIRIHERPVQARVFQLLGISDERAMAEFGHLLEAFEYGAPPHGGIAWGLDRTVMLLAGAPNIREVIPFPKALSGIDPMLGAPSVVSVELTTMLGLSVTAPPPQAVVPERPASEHEKEIHP